MSRDRGIDKEDMVHIYSVILHSHKKNEIIPLAVTWMDLEIISSVQSLSPVRFFVTP